MPNVDAARTAARLLAQRFLLEGSYTAAAGPIGTPSSGMQLAASFGSPSMWEHTQPFAGVAVQAVGYELEKVEPDVIIYATKGSLRAFRALPDEIDGVGVKVRKIGTVNIKPELASGVAGHPHVFQRNDRIACGGSCAPAGEDFAGTFGAIVERNGSIFALSNNHVFAACNHTPVNMPILAPAGIDARPNVRAPGEIARHADIVPLRSGDPDLVHPCEEDVAIAEIPDVDEVSSWQGDDSGYDSPSTTVDPTAGMRVKKVGRTTGLTTGTVEAFISEPTPIPCQTRFFRGTVWFRNVWYIIGDHSEFALPGDSGALVVEEDGSDAVGILFSSNKSGEYGLIIPISHVLGLFGGITLISNHGV